MGVALAAYGGAGMAQEKAGSGAIEVVVVTGEGKQDQRNFDSYRASLGLSGDFGNGIGWDTAATYCLGGGQPVP